MTKSVPFEEVSTKEMDTPYISFTLDNDILFCKYKDDLHVSLDVAKFCVETRIFFTQGQSYALLVDMRGVTSTTKEARRYLATVGATLVKAGALITGSALNRTIGNIFLTVDKPQVPTKLFTSEAKALAWLQQYI